MLKTSRFPKELQMVTMNLSRRIVPAIMAMGVAAVFTGGPTFAQDVIKVGAPSAR